MPDHANYTPDALGTAAFQPVKLVIWDLDDTFWRGTLAEGGVMAVPENIVIVAALSARGIINSICSKNNYALAQSELARLGVWDQFVFPRIAFTPKGAMVREIIEAAQLRPESVLFVDDNETNLHEALHYNPGLQVAAPDLLPLLLDDPRCQGKPDPAHTRLARYKVLEQKHAGRHANDGDNAAFLRASAIRISLHYDVPENFPRIHELVNRTNQLNFTKQRWPEDEAAALAAAQAEFKTAFNSHWGYVKVADRFGHYGICGFFMTRNNRALHFLFSCRSMNMGVEQFVWHKLGRPAIVSKGEVSSTLGSLPDWITLVDDADADDQPGAVPDTGRPLLCIRGSCDLAMAAHYLRTDFTTIEEYQYPYKSWVVHRTAREIAFADEREAPAVQALMVQLPDTPPHRFDSAVRTAAADVYVLSFASEIFGGLKRSRSTGAVLPLFLAEIGAKSYADFSHEELLKRSPQARFSAAQWAYMQQEYESVPFLDAALLTRDLAHLFRKLQGKRVIVLKLNTEVGTGTWSLAGFRRINEIVIPLAEAYGCTILDMAEFVRGAGDLAEGDDKGVHYTRDVYRRLAARLKALADGGERVTSPAPAAFPPLAVTSAAALSGAENQAVAQPAGAVVKKTSYKLSEIGAGNLIEIDETARINVPIRVHGNNNRLVIGRNVRVEGSILEIIGNDCSVVLSDDVVWRGVIRCRHDDSHIFMGRKTTSMHAVVTLHEAGRISIGEDCMFSGDVRFDVSDMHSIMDRTTGQRLNAARDITIGDHVWLAHGVMVLKGCSIGSGSVVGAKSLAGGVIPENVVVAGVPARIIRENIEWSRKRL